MEGPSEATGGRGLEHMWAPADSESGCSTGPSPTSHVSPWGQDQSEQCHLWAKYSQ